MKRYDYNMLNQQFNERIKPKRFSKPVRFKQIIKLLVLMMLIVTILSCNKGNDFGEQSTDASNFIPAKGMFIISEGNYTWGNGIISFYNFKTHTIANDIFYAVNKRPLGDVPQSMQQMNDLIYIVVNNSGKIEVVSSFDFSSVKTITGMTSPRYIQQIDYKKAYVSDFRSPVINILNLQTNTITGQINTIKATDRMLLYNNTVFVCNWSQYYVHQNNNTVQVINTTTDKLIDSIVVGKEPNSMVMDKNNKLWVLCSGGYNNEEIPSLVCINPNTLSVEKTLLFASKYLSPTSLDINPTKDTLYYVSNDIYKMSINETAIPLTPFIKKGTRLFYSLAVSPSTNELFISDAIDYTQNGFVFRFDANGNVMDSVRAGITPSWFSFN
ncbi:MAG: DUF5074 domain-containing protein [Bacteroidota bacterium]